MAVGYIGKKGEAGARPPTDAERAVFERFKQQVIKSRVQIQRTLIAGSICRDLQAAIDKYMIFYGPVWTKAETVEMENLARRASTLERYVTGLESGALVFRVADGDLIVLSDLAKAQRPEGYEWQEYAGLGFLAYALIAGFVLVAAAYAVSVGLETSAKKAETDYRKRLLDADKWASSVGGDTALMWNKFRQNSASKTPEHKSFWDSLMGGLSKVGSALPWIGLGLLGLWIVKEWSKGRAANA